MVYELYIKKIKATMEAMVNQGEIPKDQILEIIWEKLSVMDVPFINQANEEYEKERDKLIEEQKELSEKSEKLIDKYYNSIMKLENADEPK